MECYFGSGMWGGFPAMNWSSKQTKWINVDNSETFWVNLFSLFINAKFHIHIAWVVLPSLLFSLSPFLQRTSCLCPFPWMWMYFCFVGLKESVVIHNALSWSRVCLCVLLFYFTQSSIYGTWQYFRSDIYFF